MRLVKAVSFLKCGTSVIWSAGDRCWNGGRGWAALVSCGLEPLDHTPDAGADQVLHIIGPARRGQAVNGRGARAFVAPASRRQRRQVFLEHAQGRDVVHQVIAITGDPGLRAELRSEE